jgi:pimeloyl-ACP methyl ester carboxylesterase
LVFLHGWGDSLQTFSNLINEIGGNYEIYALDLPGFGGTQRPETPWTLDDYAQFVKDWINKIGINKDYCLLGHSFGGAVAVVGVGDNYLKPKKLVLIASAGIRNKQPFRKSAMRTVSKAGKIPLYLLPAGKAAKIKRSFYNKIGSDMLLVPSMRQTFVKTVSQDAREQAKKIKIPTMLIFGSRDKETPLSDGQILNSSIIGSKLEVIEGGHFIHQEQPKAVAELIERFLGEGRA